ASTAAAETTTAPGTGTLTPSPYWTPSGTTHYSIAAQGSVDEFVRVGERLAFDVSAYQLWTIVKPNAPVPEVDALMALDARFQVTFVSKGAVVGRATPKVGSWTGEQFYDLSGTTEPFT